MENKKNDFDFVKNIIAINKAKNSPADLRKLLKQAIKEETYSVFSSLCDEFNNPQLGLDETEVWGTLLKSGNITLLENVLKHNHSLTLKNIQKLQLTFTEYRKKNQLSKEMLDRFLNIIHKTDAYVSSKNIGNEYATIFVNSQDLKGDFPDIVINSDDVNYHFQGLTKKRVKEIGLAACLVEMLTEYEQDLSKRWTIAKGKVAKGETIEDKKNILSPAETIHFYYEENKISNIITPTELSKVDQLGKLCCAFFETPSAPLLDLFVQQRKPLVINTGKSEWIGGLYLGECIVLNDIQNLSTLHHELVHNADDVLKFSKMPVFKLLYEYCKDKALLSFLNKTKSRDFWKQMATKYKAYPKDKHQTETPAFLADFLYKETPMTQEINNVINFINAYTKAYVSNNKEERKRLTTALLKGKHSQAKYDPFTYLGKIILPSYKRLYYINRIMQERS